jgi:O-antigen ligase
LSHLISLSKVYQYLLISLAFIFPLTVFGGNVIVVIISFLWIFSGDYRSKFKLIFSNRLLISSIIFFGLHVLGLLWTENIKWGLHILHKMWYFLLFFPILYTIVSKKYIKYYVSAFLLSISLTEIVSYLIWFEFIAPFKNATVPLKTYLNPTPFMSHISYNPILAFAIYLVCHEVFLNKKISQTKFLWFIFFAITMSINMFITGGRAGQVMFFAVIAIIILQYFDKNRIKAVLSILVIIPAIFASAYQLSPFFEARVNDAVNDLIVYDQNKQTSIGKRITFAVNAFETAQQNLLIGVGTGDFPDEYKKINLVNSPELESVENPHNMYTLILGQLGIIGLISLLSIFYYQIKLSFQASNRFIKDVGIAMPLLFLLIMWSDSYLLGHYTTLLYVFFSSFLYRDFEKT